MTSDSHYQPFNTLQELADFAKSEVAASRVINFVLRAELTPKAIKNEPLSDVTETAQMWRAPERPGELYINHGEFIGDGLEHIKAELKRKPSSNRALYSLINQKDVSGSSDRPIPSFMVFQCAVVESVLYCTAYFRALEVSTFLPINLEEVRLNLCELLDELDVGKVRLCVFAFNAYASPDRIPLRRCKLDLLSALRLQDLYNKNRESIAALFDEKAREHTVVDLSGLKAVQEWLCPDRKDNWPSGLNVNEVNANIKDAIGLGERLISLRHSASHSDRLDEASAEFSAVMKKIAGIFRK
jgi:hypothetical protein